MRGRRPKPTALHHLHGTFNVTDHRDRALEPKAAGELYAAPAGLTSAQRLSWRYAIRHAPRGVLHLIDRDVLRAWVETLERRHKAQQILDRIKGDAAWITSPSHRVIDRTTALMIRLAAELGFSPAARPRIKLDAPDAEENEWAMFKVLPGGKE